MKSPKELENRLKDLIARNKVAVESKTQDGVKYVRLLLLPNDRENTVDNNGFLVKPQYVGRAEHPGEENVSAVMRRLLTQGLNVEALSFLPALDSEVIDFVLASSKTNEFIQGNEEKFEFFSASNEVVKVYQIDTNASMFDEEFWRTHSFMPSQETVDKAVAKGYYRMVGMVAVGQVGKHALSKTFDAFQNEDPYDDGWTNKKSVIAVETASSGSVGNVFVSSEGAFLVKGSGFQHLNGFAPEGIAARPTDDLAPGR